MIECMVCGSDYHAPVGNTDKTVGGHSGWECSCDASGVCSRCRADAKLGAVIRRMPAGQYILRQGDVWCHYRGLCCECGFNVKGDTPEAALVAAGLMKE